MLIEFSVTNFRSFAEEQTLSLVRGTGKGLEDINTFEVQIATNKWVELLRTAVIYGANAAGKTNFLDAMMVMRAIVLGDTEKWDDLPVTPFRLAKTWRNKPSEFEIALVIGRVWYVYGFSATDAHICDEWLTAYPKGRPQLWFERKWNKKTHKHKWELGGNLRGPKQSWQKHTRPDALFLSTAVSLNSEQLKPIYDWFRKNLFMAMHDRMMHGKVILGRRDAPLQNLHIRVAERASKYRRKQILTLLQSMDIDILDVHPGDVDGIRPDVEVKYKTREGDIVRFGFEDESSGTQRLYGLANYLLEALESGGVFVMDELNTHLHPELVEALVQLFHNDKVNVNNAQLIFTTHETSVMGPDVFRRDQVWFCERNRQQESVLYSLFDYEQSKRHENISASYRGGRYGAVPFIQGSLLGELGIGESKGKYE